MKKPLPGSGFHSEATIKKVRADRQFAVEHLNEGQVRPGWAHEPTWQMNHALER